MAFREILLAGYSGQSRAGKIAASCPLGQPITARDLGRLARSRNQPSNNSCYWTLYSHIACLHPSVKWVPLNKCWAPNSEIDQHPTKGDQKYSQSLHATETGDMQQPDGSRGQYAGFTPPCLRQLSPQYMRQSKIRCPTETTRKQPFSSSLAKIKAMVKMLWPLVIINQRIPGLI